MLTEDLTINPVWEALRQAFNRNSTGSLAERTYLTLKTAILIGDIPPKTRLSEMELIDVLPVSRTPMREALHRLESEGIVFGTPGRGFKVRGLSRADLLEIYEVLSILEGSAIEKGIDNYSAHDLEEAQHHIDLGNFYADRGKWTEMLHHSVSFHVLLTSGVKNSQLSSIIGDLRQKTHSFRRHQLQQSGEWHRGLTQHQELLDAIKAKDGELAKSLMVEHLEGSIRLIQELDDDL